MALFLAILFALLVGIAIGCAFGYWIGLSRGKEIEAAKWKGKEDWKVKEAEKHE